MAERLGEASDVCRSKASQMPSGQVISVQNGEHTFCSKKRYDEEKSFRGHSSLPAKQAASGARQPFSVRLASILNGEGISDRNLLPRLIDIVVVRRQEDVRLQLTDRPPLTFSGRSDIRNIRQRYGRLSERYVFSRLGAYKKAR